MLSKGECAERLFIKIGVLVESLSTKCLCKLPEPLLSMFIYPRQNLNLSKYFANEAKNHTETQTCLQSF